MSRKKLRPLDEGKSTIAERLEWVFGPANADLRPRERLLLAYIAFRDGDGKCWGTIESLASATGMSASVVRRAVRILEGAIQYEETPLVRVPTTTLPVRIRRAGNRWITCREVSVRAVDSTGGGSRFDRSPSRPGRNDFCPPVDSTARTSELDDERAPPRPNPLDGGRVGAPEEALQGELLLPRVIEGTGEHAEPDHHQTIAAIRRSLGAS